MKYLIFSDAHGDYKEFEKIINFYSNDKDIVEIFYNGDSEFRNDDPIFKNVLTVEGNMDIESFSIENQVKEKEDNVKFFQVHGHIQHIEIDFRKLEELAKKNKADIVLFGHTHELTTFRDDDILFINPGSISLPRGEYKNIGGTYVILTVTKEKYIVDFYNRDMKKINNLSKIYERNN